MKWNWSVIKKVFKTFYIFKIFCCYQIVNQTLELTISLTTEEINDLGGDIRKTVSDLTNIDSILHETRNDIENAQSLLQDAQRSQFVMLDC